MAVMAYSGRASKKLSTYFNVDLSIILLVVIKVTLNIK